MGLEDTMYSIAATSSEIFSPTKNVIVDMVMVQLLSIVVTLGAVLLLGAANLTSTAMAYLVAGLFGSLFLLGGIYARISEA